MLANCHKHVLIADSECNEQSPARPACIWTEALVLMDQQNAGKKTHGIMWHVASSRTKGNTTPRPRLSFVGCHDGLGARIKTHHLCFTQRFLMGALASHNEGDGQGRVKTNNRTG